MSHSVSHFKLEVARLKLVTRSLVLGKGVGILWFIWHLPNVGVEDRVFVKYLIHGGGLFNGGWLPNCGGLLNGGRLLDSGTLLHDGGRVSSERLTVGIFPVGFHLGEIKQVVVLNHRIRQRVLNTFLSLVRFLNRDRVRLHLVKVDLVASSVFGALLDRFALSFFFRRTSNGPIKPALNLFLTSGYLLIEASSAGPRVCQQAGTARVRSE